MRHLTRLGLAAGLLCALTTTALAAPLPAAGRADADLKAAWNTAKTALHQGAYREALESLDVILTITPNDPWAQLYHSLCELRLSSPQEFPQLSADQLKELHQRLRQEAKSQRRTAARNHTIERQIQQEQAKWDHELLVLQQQADRQRQRERTIAQATAVEQAKAEQARQYAAAQQALEQARQLTQQPATSPTTTPSPSVVSEQPKAQTTEVPPAVPPAQQPESTTPSAPSTSEISPQPQVQEQPPPTPQGSPTIPGAVELSPVIVPTTAGPSTGGRTGITPTLVGRSLPPPGAVQINARQMNVSPDRKIATADGDVEVLYGNAILTCDHLTLFTDTKDVYAEGRVRLEEGAQVFRGDMVHYNFETKKGRFLQGTISSPPWYQHGRSLEHLAEGVYEVTPGYITSCDLEPPHFQFYGRRAIVFADDRTAKLSNSALLVDKVPLLFLPFISFTEQQSPFFIVPGKKKPWGPFALMGYRYEMPPLPGGGTQNGTIKMDWRRFFLWGFGADHQIDHPILGKALLKAYYNEEQDLSVQNPKVSLPKGATQNRYRVLWRHDWQPLPDTRIITDFQKYSDSNFRKDFLFREEYVNDDQPESFISLVTNTPEYSLTGLVKKRVNRFQTVTEALPEITFNVRPERIGETQFFSDSQVDFANLNAKNANSEIDTDVIRFDWFQQLKYAMRLFQPVEVTPRVGVRQTFYTKDIQGSTREGQRDFFAGQFSSGVDASLKLFKIFPITTNAFGLDLHGLRHVITPTVSYAQAHRPTILNNFLSFPTASSATSQLTFGLENKLQTRRVISEVKKDQRNNPSQSSSPPGQAAAKPHLQSVDLVRFLVSVPYNFKNNGNKQGGRVGDWPFKLELYPFTWMRLESDWNYRTHLSDTLTQNDSHYSSWNLDLVMVGGKDQPQAQYASGIEAPSYQALQPGRQSVVNLIPQGQWFLGLGHRYSQNDKTESVLQFNWRLSDKWQLGTFQRLTWKEVATTATGTAKRFYNLREYQYTLKRDLHDWIGEVVYHVDREYGEEIYFTLTLKAYPKMPIATSTSYNEPKFGSQSSPFSPIRGQIPQQLSQ